jgi:L-asparagine transporter-like permease
MLLQHNRSILKRMAFSQVERERHADQLVANEQGLARQLTQRQLGMMAIGSAIGTGLFLGSALSIRVAGPSVILTYLFVGFIVMLLMGCLAEMAVAHPTAGSFGIYAELYLSRWAGFTIRYTYWVAVSISVGSEAIAAAIYTQWWFPHSPMWGWVVFYSAVLVVVNAMSIGAFGEFEYWFSMIKVSAIIVFILLGVAVLFGYHQDRPIGLENFRQYGGFLPHGIRGAWLATVFVVFSFLGSEVVAVSAGEAKYPERAVPRAMRSMLARLMVFYVGAIAVLVGVVPWTQIQPGQSITVSPFVRVFELVHIPAAAHIVNFVVLTAAISSMNCNLYLGTRMVFSLARGGYAPEAMGRVTRQGTPLIALLSSAAGLAIAMVLAVVLPGSAYVYMFGVSLFGGIFAWFLIFLTHLRFRERTRGETVRRFLPLYPWTTIFGGVAVLAILASTWWVQEMRVTLQAGVPWLVLATTGYVFAERRRRLRIGVPQSRATPEAAD